MTGVENIRNKYKQQENRSRYISKRNALVGCVIVAHPDDETIWAGGILLMHPEWQWTLISLCRASDNDRAEKFQRTAKSLGASSIMADLDDGPEQEALSEYYVQQTILSLLPPQKFDLVLTHSPFGEYTRHRRHEETGLAVGELWKKRSISCDELWMFAYQDTGKGGREDPPLPISEAHQKLVLPEYIWEKKYQIITTVYGFSPESYEGEAVLKEEAFWSFANPLEYERWLKSRRRDCESTRTL